MITLLKKFLLAAFLSVAFMLGVTQAEAATLSQNVKGDLKITMLNVGHADAILIQTGKQTILIDTATAEIRGVVIKELEKLSVTKIDKLILTHPHADHIGGAKMLLDPVEKEVAKYPYLKKISIGKVYDNGVVHTSKPYRRYMTSINEKGIAHQSLKTGDILDFGNGVKFKVLFPTAKYVETVNADPLKKDGEYKMNNGSIVGKLTYKNFSMMFTGDCEKESEAKILASNNARDLKCDVLKSGHHGVGTSSTKEFVKAINPSAVLISTADKIENNVRTGHPGVGVLRSYLQCVNQKNIFCTRFNGVITVTSDGQNFSVTPEKKEDWVDKWIAHKQNLAKK